MLTDLFLAQLKQWAAEDPGITALLIVGSYARGANKPDSDLDLVILTSRKAEMVQNHSFVNRFGDVERQQTEEYGACTSVRAWYRDGREIEFGLVEPSWASVPLDSGTHRVLSDGYLVLTDKEGLFTDLKL